MAISNLVLPKIESTAMSQEYGRFIIAPLERGYGTTLGNSLRRVLLASLPGAAVTSIRVLDVPHEFSAIPNVREDMMQFILVILTCSASCSSVCNIWGYIMIQVCV